MLKLEVGDEGDVSFTFKGDMSEIETQLSAALQKLYEKISQVIETDYPFERFIAELTCGALVLGIGVDIHKKENRAERFAESLKQEIIENMKFFREFEAQEAKEKDE